MRVCVALIISAAAGFGQQPYFTEPAVAPDRGEIAFVSGGDIWTAPLAGGEAHLLVSHPATESRPMYSPDGTRLAFVSTRTGNGDIYVLDLAGGALRRITFDDSAEVLDGWSRDGRWLYFSSTTQDISGMSDVYRVSAGGGTPMPVSADRYVTEFFSAPSPAGDVLAITARGMTASQWWRHGHSHLDESEIWLERMGAAPAYEKLQGGDFKCLWPMWSADGARVYFMSDEGGAENIWEKPVKGGAARQVTRFTGGRVLWPSISYDGKTIVFERDFRIWKLETASGKAAPVAITRRGATAAPGVTHLTLTSGFRDLALAPDGRKIAFTAHGEVFAAGAKEGGQAARVTRTAAREDGIAWSPDSKRVAYVSDRDGRYQVYLYEFASGQETRVSDGAGADTAPRFSPDGKLLAFVRDSRELRVYDVAGKQSRALAAGYFPRPPMSSNRFYAWAPDSKWVAYSNSGERGFRNVWVVPAAGGEPRQASFLANTNGGAVVWSPDGTYLLFDTTQRTENNRIARVDLVPRAPKFREDRFRDLFQETAAQARPAGTGGAGAVAAAAPAKPVAIVFDGIRDRLSVLPIGLDARLEGISADGKTLLVSATAARQENLYTYSLDELAAEPAVARQVTSTAGAKDDAQFSPDGKEIFYLEQGRVTVATLETRAARPLAVTAEMDVDFEQEKSEVFAEAWTYLNDNFFDPKFNGVDWRAQRERFAPLAAGARTPDELRRVISLMIGDLNASHMGISAPAGGGAAGAAFTVGKIGLRFDPAEYWASGRFRVREVIPLGPAALAGGIGPGDYVTAIDGVKLAAAANLDELLDHNVGRRVTLTVGDRAVAVRPVTTAAEKDLVYRQWVEAQRAYVARASGGRLGYVHIRDMSAEALEQLYLDLDTGNQGREGVVVDVRNNNGGFVNVYAIDVLARRSYLRMTPRDRQTAPARIVLGQRALERPTILVTNRHSLSDAEDFTEGYRALKLGKVVGEPTAGWIIYTSNTALIDGSVLRLPQTRVTTAEGAAMELAPRPVDIAVDKPVGEGEAGKDSQLDAAVRELLKEIDAKKGK
ncbi:MAG: PD40 domain-containing protein [Acidobacteria bacterium]|nr:PD40 domain-containing protein [Acidobacteriota bacterium]